MKKHLNGQDIEMTTEEISERENIIAEENTKLDEYNAELTAKETLKASAKAKLVAGEALTEEEANTIVL
jgi:hypothetical protein